MRNLTREEIYALEQRGCSAEEWGNVMVSPLFIVSQLSHARFVGRVEIEDEVIIKDSSVGNYHISHGSVIDSVSRLECRKESMFGNGVDVNTINECGGRNVRMFNSMSAQTAYLASMYCHRPKLREQLGRIADSEAAKVKSTMGTIGKNCTLICSGIIREVNMADYSRIEGASYLENGTLLAYATIGADVKARNFIVAENAKVDFGAILDTCFIGESSEVLNGFTAVNTLAFANCELENGEANAVFLGPYTVSHHKSSLLIAGYFSFFNAGSGTNQSNHLFKEGAVHQSTHLRGCKFASNGYVMSPAREGAFSMVMGRHVRHHDTVNMPFSYLIENNGISTLLPGRGLYSYGMVRDMAKWPKRDKRSLLRDQISFDEYNPYLAWYTLKGLEDLKALRCQFPDAERYSYCGTSISASMAKKGMEMYEKYLKATVCVMLKSRTVPTGRPGKWVDAGGQYIPQSWIDDIATQIEEGVVTSCKEIDSLFRSAAGKYDEWANEWANALLELLLGRKTTDEDIRDVIKEGKSVLESFATIREADGNHDHSVEMSVGYGIDGDENTAWEDFKCVRGLK